MNAAATSDMMDMMHFIWLHIYYGNAKNDWKAVWRKQQEEPSSHVEIKTKSPQSRITSLLREHIREAFVWLLCLVHSIWVLHLYFYNNSNYLRFVKWWWR